MSELREQILILVTTPLYLVIIGAELFVSNYRSRKLYSWKDIAANVYLMIANSAVELVIRLFYFGLFVFAFDHRIMNVTSSWAYWGMLLLAEDLLYYWLHRFDHYVRIFWAVHVTHHSSSYMNFTVGFRSSVFQPLYRFIYFLPLPFLGFEPADILFIYAATQIWGILVHTELIGKMGILEHVLVTPSHHRVHHASNARYLDRNMGMFLIIWDKIFGTFQEELTEEEYEPIRYGLTTPPENVNAANVIFHEWASIGKDISRKDIGAREKLHYLFGPPGWSHDGSRKTSEQMREMEGLVNTRRKTLAN
jgi:sterol desaturase/sphingolipid hydroxylase (fatty acid hydroxylase superfamily)